MRVAAKLIAWGINDSEIIQAALLHDVLEDTDTRFGQLADTFSLKVATYVWLLSEQHADAVSIRAFRKKLYNAQIAAANDEVKLIKIADIYDNLSDLQLVFIQDPRFANIYLREKEACMMSIYPGSLAFYPALEVIDIINQLKKDIN